MFTASGTHNRKVAQLIKDRNLANSFRYAGTTDRDATAIRADRRSNGEGRSE
jgi:hypothetical protein